MAQFIHARKTERGLRFRLWSSNSDSYYTKEMTEQELREHTLKEAVCRAIDDHNREIDERIRRASTIGSSGLLSEARSLDGPWDKKRS